MDDCIYDFMSRKVDLCCVTCGKRSLLAHASLQYILKRVPQCACVRVAGHGECAAYCLLAATATLWLPRDEGGRRCRALLPSSEAPIEFAISLNSALVRDKSSCQPPDSPPNGAASANGHTLLYCIY
jgi:hypothetical protein